MILDTLKEKSRLLDQWKTIHEREFGPGTHDIPDSAEVCLSKLGKGGGGAMTDNCNAANALGRKFAERAENIAREKVLEEGGD